MNEFELIRHYFAQQPALVPPGAPGSLLPVPESHTGEGTSLLSLGIGDDCALLDALPAGQQLAVSTDMLVAGRHFFEGTDPASIGHKALAVNLSDLAAMGARPVGFTLALALPAVDEAWLAAFAGGLLGLASRAACPLIGGDTTRGPLTLSVTVFGRVPAGAALRRDGARPGDDVWVSGELGAAALAVQRRYQWQTQCREQGPHQALGGRIVIPPEAAGRLDWPQPRLAEGLALRGLATAAMDISDGLAGDLAHLLTASGRRLGLELGADLQESMLPLPACLQALSRDEALRLALHGGDDYELLFTAPPDRADAVRRRCPQARQIGRIRAGGGMLLTDASGRSRPLDATGHDHFST